MPLCYRTGFMKLQAACRGVRSRSHVCGVMFVRAIRGVKLADRELFGKQDPYVMVSLMDPSGVTLATGTTGTVVKGGRNPVWTERHNNVVWLAYARRVGQPAYLKAVAWDEDNIKKHDLIGVFDV